MDFSSIVESLASAPFHTGGWPVSTACEHNCFNKNHYHRHCGCALHYVDTAFKGSSACSQPKKVKVSGSGNSTGRMYRSISAENLGEKKFQSGNISGGSGSYSYSVDDFVTSPARSPEVSFLSSVSTLSHIGMGSNDSLTS